MAIVFPQTPQSAKADHLIFLHIPKTAGTTFNRILEWEYPPHRIHTINASALSWSHRHFISLPLRRRRAILLLKGHMHHGLHEHLPGTSTYITFCREPAERVLSAYFFIRNHWLHPDFRRHRSSGISLEQFVAESESHVNVQTKLLAGLKPHEPCGEESLQRALHNLRECYAVVGLTERFEESLLLMARLFGWKLPYYANFRVMTQRPRAAAISPEIRRQIAVRNTYDVEIYREAQALFAGIQQALGPVGQEEVAAFRARCASVSTWERRKYYARSVVRAAATLVRSAL